MSAARDWSDLSAEARSAKVNAVAKQMVDVQEDAEFATRIAAALPERRSRLFLVRRSLREGGWLIPQLGAAAIAIAAVAWFNREAPAPPESTMAMVPLRAAVDAVEPFRVQPLEPVEPLEAMEPGTEPVEPVVAVEPVEPVAVDHERALPAAEAPRALAMSDLTPRDLPALAPLTLPPLEIGELALAGDTVSPREFQ